MGVRDEVIDVKGQLSEGQRAADWGVRDLLIHTQSVAASCSGAAQLRGFVSSTARLSVCKKSSARLSLLEQISFARLLGASTTYTRTFPLKPNFSEVFNKKEL